MSSHHDESTHHHREAEQNEIAGPVVFAIMLTIIATVIIYFWAR